jgi:hypothetical protein
MQHCGTILIFLCVDNFNFLVYGHFSFCTDSFDFFPINFFLYFYSVCSL